MLKGENKELVNDFYLLLKKGTEGLTTKKVRIILDFIKNTFPKHDQGNEISWYHARQRWLKSTIVKYEGLLEKLKLLDKHFELEIEEQTDSEIKRDALDHLRSEIKAKLQRNKEKSTLPGWYKAKAEKLAVVLKYLDDVDTGVYKVHKGRQWVNPPPPRGSKILAPKSPSREEEEFDLDLVDSPKPSRPKSKSSPQVDIDLLDSEEEDKKKRPKKKPLIDLTRSEALECLVCGIAGVGLSREHTSPPQRVFCGTDCQKEFYFKE